MPKQVAHFMDVTEFPRKENEWEPKRSGKIHRRVD